MNRDLYGRAQIVVRELSRCGYTLATAESLTAGMIASTVASVPGASQVLRGGLIVYATDLKESLAGVDTSLLNERGPIDSEVALQLARGARSRCGADIGIGVTGVAGPGPQDNHPVGEIYCAISLCFSSRGAEEKGVVEQCISLDPILSHPQHECEGEKTACGDFRQQLREKTVLASFSLILDLLSSCSALDSGTGNNEGR